MNSIFVGVIFMGILGIIIMVGIVIFKPSLLGTSSSSSASTKKSSTTTTTKTPNKKTTQAQTTTTQMPTSYPYSPIISTTTETSETNTTETEVAGTFSATGSYASYKVDAYDVVVFTGNGTIRFSKNTNVSIIVVGGGGGGGGGTTDIGWTGQPYSSNRYTIYYNANGGDGGANIFCEMTSVAGDTYDIVVGTGGSAGAVGSSGGAGGDTIFSDNDNVALITCAGGAGGAYNGSNTNVSSYYNVDTSLIQNVQSGNYTSNNTLQGGAGGKEASGTNSATYNVPFTGIPESLRLDTTLNSYIKTYYSGGGGGSTDGKGGDAGNGVGGSITTNVTGTDASLYGAGGGGGGEGTGGAGASGIVILYFTL